MTVRTVTKGYQIIRCCTDSAIPYLSVLIVGFVSASFVDYLYRHVYPGIPLVKGQPPLVWLSGLTFACAVVLWLIYDGRRSKDPWFNSFIWAMIIAWVIHMSLAIIHRDGYTHPVWIYVPILLMIWWKTPSYRDVSTTTEVFAWSIVLVLVATRTLELLGVIPMLDVGKDLVRFESEYYWLPLSGWLGPEGRWPGPMGGTADTSTLAALLVVFGAAKRSRYRAVFVVVGGLALLLTSVRGAFAAAIAGLLVAILLSKARWLMRVPQSARLPIAAGALIATFGLLFLQSPNLTGRTTSVWPEFLRLWEQAPLIGVGATGIATGGSVTQSATQGHNLLIDELARNGLIGIIFQGAAIGIGLLIAIRAANSAFGAPLALLVTYFVGGVAFAPNGWLGPSLPWLFILLSILLASTWLIESKPVVGSVRGSPPG